MIAAAIPMLLMAYTVIVWPLLYAEPVYTATTEYSAPVAAPSFLLSKIYIPLLFVLSIAAFAADRPSLSRGEQKLLLWFGAFFALCALSAMWSLDPAFTLKKAAYQLVLFTTVALSVFTARNGHRVLLLVFALFVIAIFANLIEVASRPPGPIGHEGIYNHKNTLGSTMVLASMFALYFLIAGKPFVRLVALSAMVGCVFLLLESQSKTALGLAVFAPIAGWLLYVLSEHLRISPVVSIVFSVVLTAAIYGLTSALFGLDGSDVLGFAFDDVSFTGRTEIWAFVWEHIQKHPMLGHGFEGFWSIPDSPKFAAEKPFIARMAHGHNGFLDMVLNLGLVGFAGYALLIGKVLKDCGDYRNARNSALSWFLLATMLVVLCTNFMESLILLSEGVGQIVFLLIAIFAASPVRGIVVEPASTHRIVSFAPAMQARL